MTDDERLAAVRAVVPAEKIDEFLNAGVTIDELYWGLESLTQKKNPFGCYRLSELSDDERQPPEFLVDGVVPVGLTFLSGAPKIRKSFLALQLSAAIGAGQPFLGFKTTKSGVLYCDLEGSRSRTASRTEKMGLDLPDSVLITNEIDCGIADGLIEKLDNFLVMNPIIKMVIIDTYSRARGVFKPNGCNAYDSDVQLLSPLQRFALDKKIAVLAVHHDRKTQIFAMTVSSA